jgi:hypothetical protein
MVGTKAPPIGMLIDPDTGTETNSIEEVARVLLDKHLPGSKTPNNHNQNHIKSKKYRTKPPRTIDLEAKDLKFITVNKLKEAFNQFGAHKSPGPDNLKPIVL